MPGLVWNTAFGDVKCYRVMIINHIARPTLHVEKLTIAKKQKHSKGNEHTSTKALQLGDLLR